MEDPGQPVPAARVSPSGEKDNEKTFGAGMFPDVHRDHKRAPSETRQSLMEPRMPPETSVCPCGEKATERIPPLSLEARVITGAPSETRQSWMEESLELVPAASVSPSGEKDNEKTIGTGSFPDVRLDHKSAPSETRQSRMTPSTPPDASVCPSGENDMEVTELVCP
jgi:hypothetical protein